MKKKSKETSIKQKRGREEKKAKKKNLRKDNKQHRLKANFDIKNKYKHISNHEKN